MVRSYALPSIITYYKWFTIILIFLNNVQACVHARSLYVYIYILVSNYLSFFTVRFY